MEWSKSPAGASTWVTPACSGERRESAWSCTLRNGPREPSRKSSVTMVRLAARRAASTTRDFVDLRYDILLTATSPGGPAILRPAPRPPAPIGRRDHAGGDAP